MNTVDQCTRLCAWVEVAGHLTGDEVLYRLTDLLVWRGGKLVAEQRYLKCLDGKGRDSFLGREASHTPKEEVLMECWGS